MRIGVSTKALNKNRYLRGLWAIAACLAAGLHPAGAWAETRTYTIDAQSLDTALKAFAFQSNREIFFAPELTRGKQTRGINGQYDDLTALQALLAESGLTYVVTESKAILVRDPSKAQPTAKVREGYGLERVAQVDDAATQSEGKERNASSRIRVAGYGAADNAAAPQAAQDAGTRGKAGGAEGEIVVTGTHIRGVENTTAPLIVMDRQFIESTGLTTTIQLIEQLPQNFALTNQSAAGGALSGNSFSTIQGSSINLRAMGEGTTLTLVNGRRLPLSYDGSAVNIATLPLSAIERVEVLTDGASALYGSDAVGGVVNFVFRKDFEGAEFRGRMASADNVDEHKLSQVIGRSWDSGNVVFAGEHYKRGMLAAADRNFGVNGVTTVGTLLPKENNYAFTLLGRQQLAPGVELSADVLYTTRDSFNRSFQGTGVAQTDIYVDNSVLSASGGIGWNLGANWRADLSAVHGEDNLDIDIYYPSTTTPRGRTPIVTKFTGGDLKADGPVFALPGGMVRMAVGGHYRKESHDYQLVQENAAGVITNNPKFNKERNVSSLFAEASVPLIGSGNAKSGAQRVDLSLAARYDDYSDFGSSVDPRVGLSWTPVAGLKFRGSWGTSFLAPKMKDFDLAFNTPLAIQNYAAANNLTVLQVSGNAPESLKAQESTNYSIGLDWSPTSIPGATLSINYYDIEYKDKIDSVNLTFDQLLGNPAAYGALFILNPTLAQVNQYIAYGELGRPFSAYTSTFAPIVPVSNFDRSSVNVIVDARRRNIGVLKTNGIDLSAAYEFAALGGNINLGFSGAYIFELLKQITPTSQAFETVDTYANPTHLKLRGNVGYRRGGWAFNTFVYRKNAYTDSRFAPNVGIDAYTTVDMNLGYNFGEREGVLSGASLTFGAINAFDKDPPALRVRPGGFYDLGFDAANASPVGRQLTLEFVKRW